MAIALSLDSSSTLGSGSGGGPDALAALVPSGGGLSDTVSATAVPDALTVISPESPCVWRAVRASALDPGAPLDIGDGDSVSRTPHFPQKFAVLRLIA